MIAKLLTVLAVVCAVWCDEEDVRVLTTQNFDDVIAQNSLVMVEFYAPWCGHCKKLAPEYAKAAGELKGKDVVVAKVDATVESELGEKFGVQGYPTLKVFSEGKPSDYEGGRSAADMVSFLKKQMGPAVKDLDADSFGEFTEDGPVLVAFVEAGSSDDALYRRLASSNRNEFTFGAVTDAAVAAAQGEKMGSFVLYKPFDEKKNVFAGDVAEDGALLTWLKEVSVPLVAEIGPDNYKMYMDRGLPISWLFYTPQNMEAFETAKAEYAKVAPDFRGVSFVFLDGAQYSQMVTKMALSGDVLPAIAIETAAGDHFVFDEKTDITEENLRTFFSDYTAGKLQAKIRSEAIPDPANDEDGVRILVGNNFKEVAFDESLDVLVEFYAPWCGHCKKLIPVYAEVAQAFENTKSVVIAKMDATANDATGIQVQGFPTIKFVKGGTNEVMDYNGARTKDGFVEFIQKNANTPVQL